MKRCEHCHQFTLYHHKSCRTRVTHTNLIHSFPFLRETITECFLTGNFDPIYDILIVLETSYEEV